MDPQDKFSTIDSIKNCLILLIFALYKFFFFKENHTISGIRIPEVNWLGQRLYLDVVRSDFC